MPEDTTSDAIMQMRNYVDERFSRLSGESARTADLLARQPVDGVNLREHFEGRLDRQVQEATAFMSAMRDLYDERIHKVESDLTNKIVSLEHAMDLQFKNAEMAVSTAISAVQEYDKAHATGHAREHEATSLLVSATVHALEVKSDGAVKNIEESMAEHRNMHDKERMQNERAMDKFEHTVTERAEESNNFKSQIQQERIDYVRRDMLEQRAHATDVVIDLLRVDVDKRINQMRDDTDKKLDPIISWRSTQTGRGEVSSGIWAVAAAIFVSLVVVAVQLVLMG
jgi:hypothetical protein